MKKLMFAFLFGSLFIACNKFEEIETLQNDETGAEFAVPIGKAEFNLQELLDNLDASDSTNIFVDPDGTIRLKYRGRLAIKTAFDVFESVQRTLTSIPVFPVLDSVMALPFGAPDSIDIDFMNLKKGRMIINLGNASLDVFRVNYEFRNVIKDGAPLRDTFLLGPGSFTDTVDLNGYQLVPENDSIYFEYTAVSLVSGNRVLVPLFLMSIQDIEFSYMEGYFGQIVHEGDPDTIKIDFFENWTRGDVYFEDPTITIMVNNSFGVPTQSLINYFKVKTVKDPDPVDLMSQYITDGVDFGYPRLPDQVGQTISSHFVFDKSNSNIDKILGAGPQFIYYDVDAITNPDRNQAVRGFITDQSQYDVQVEAELPLYGRTNGYAVEDTIDWNFSDFEDVKSVEFKIISENELGVGIALQGYFVDEAGVVLDSLFESQKFIVDAAPVDDSGNVISKTKKITFAPFAADRLEKIKAAQYILLNAFFVTSNNGDTSVRVLNTQKFEVRMGMKVAY